MSHVTSLLARPSTLGFLAVAGSGALYVGMKGRTMAAKQQAQTKSTEGAQKDGSGKGADRDKNYHVRAGERSGGGV